MKTQTHSLEQKLDTIFSEIKQRVVTSKNGINYHSDIDHEINMIARCEHRGRLIDMKSHCENAITLIVKQIIKHE